MPVVSEKNVRENREWKNIFSFSICLTCSVMGFLDSQMPFSYSGEFAMLAVTCSFAFFILDLTQTVTSRVLYLTTPPDF